MKVLAVDPGFGRCGVAVVEKENGREHYCYSACVETSAQDSFHERLASVVDECVRLMELHEPNALALERLFVTKNQKTAMQVSEVRGALMYCAHRRGIPVFEYTPGQVKAAVTGSGSADKAAVATLLRALLKIEKHITHDDEYDAIAVGVAHCATYRGKI
jgi:crossover junction endodeoxyribonuclease RuvC